MRPKVVPLPTADPWLLGTEALDALDHIRRFLTPHGGVMDALDLVGERIRQLCYGPENPP